MMNVTETTLHVTDDREGVTDDEVAALLSQVDHLDIEWTREDVMDRLVAGIRFVQRTAGRAGPKSYGRSMPDYDYSAIDLWWQQTQESWEREHGDFERNRPTIGATRQEIVEADEALAWIARFVELEHVRRALNSWLLAKATRRPWKKVTKELGMVHRTAIARRDRAIALIVYGLTGEAIAKAQAAGASDAKA